MRKRYTEKLLDPRWQRRRLEILNRDEFTCQECGNDEDTLHVHHRYYRRGSEPWEYPDAALVTLCKTCHEYETDLLDKSKTMLIEAICESGLGAYHIYKLSEAIKNSPSAFRHVPDVIVSVLEYSWKPDIYEKIKEDFFQELAEKAGRK